MLRNPEETNGASLHKGFEETIQRMMTLPKVPRDEFRDAFHYAVHNVYGSRKECASKMEISVGTVHRWEKYGAPSSINRNAAVRIIAQDLGIPVSKPNF